jgi:hypothetical protein
MGVAGATPDFHLSFFFFLKKKGKKLMAKMTSFWVGWVL